MDKLQFLFIFFMVSIVIAQNDIPREFQLTQQWKEKIISKIPENLNNYAGKKYKLLVFTLSTGYQHWVVPHTTAVLEALGETTGAFEVVVSDDIQMFSVDSIRQFDGIILNNNCPKDDNNTFLDVLGDDKIDEANALENSLLNFVKNGGGIVGIHGGIILLNGSEKFSQLMGGSFDFHPKRQQLILEVVDDKNDLTKCFNDQMFIHYDEAYIFKGAYDKKEFTPLLKLNTKKINAGKRQAYVESDVRYASWIKNYGKGKVFYCAPSHNAQSFENPELLEFIFNGIMYTLEE